MNITDSNLSLPLSNFEFWAKEGFNLKRVSSLAHRKHFFKAPGLASNIIKLHSNLIDKIFGYKMRTCENIILTKAKLLANTNNLGLLGPSLFDGEQVWLGLDPQILNTSYHEFFELFKTIEALIKHQKNFTICDLGAGYARMGLFLHYSYPTVLYHGVELVPERVNEVKRIYELHQCTNATIEINDIQAKNFTYPEANLYFLYDYGSNSSIFNTLKQLSYLKNNELIVVFGSRTLKIIEEQFSNLTRVYASKGNLQQSHIYKVI